MKKLQHLLLSVLVSFLGIISIFGMQVHQVPENYLLLRTTIWGLGTEIESEEHKRFFILPLIHSKKEIPLKLPVIYLQPDDGDKWEMDKGIELATSLELELAFKKDNKLLKQFIQEFGVEYMGTSDWMYQHLIPLLKVCISKVSRQFNLNIYTNYPHIVLEAAFRLIPKSSQYVEIKKVRFLNIENRKLLQLDEHIQERLLKYFISEP